MSDTLQNAILDLVQMVKTNRLMSVTVFMGSYEEELGHKLMVPDKEQLESRRSRKEKVDTVKSKILAEVGSENVTFTNRYHVAWRESEMEFYSYPEVKIVIAKVTR